MCPLWALVTILCLHFGGLCNAYEIQLLTVEYGDSVVLPCDGSAFTWEGGTVHWETWSTDVAVLRGGEQTIGPYFEGRIQLPSEEEISKGNWSVTITQTKMRDSSVYECFWRERKSLSTVTLTVQEPHVEPYRMVYAGTMVDIPCYIDSSRFLSNYLEVIWTKDGILVFSAEEDATKEEFLLQMIAETADSGKYECWFRTRTTESLIRGIPESITLTVLEQIPTESVFEYGETATATVDDWVSSPRWSIFPWTEGETKTTESPLTDSTQPIDGEPYPSHLATESQPMETFEKTATSFPDEETSETTSFQWDNLPWVRIGLIGGVLLVTSIVLCILGALSKI